MPEVQKGRVFLVGCPRSGTTLLQSLLAAHPDVLSLPESHFFAYLVPRIPTLGVWGIASPRVKRRFRRFLTEIGQEAMQKRIPRLALSMRCYCNVFVDVLDTLAEHNLKSLWLEKTPRHVRYISYIERFVPGARFIHILRNGPDVVASLYQVTHEHPEAWSGARSIDRCVGRWIEDIRTSLAHQGRPTHKLVTYQRLVSDPRAVLTDLCDFLGIHFDPAMIADHGAAAAQVVTDKEPWKASVDEDIHNANATKFYKVFDEEQRRYILDRVSAANLGAIVASFIHSEGQN